MLLDHDHSELDEILARFFSELEAGAIPESLAALDRFWAHLAVHIRAEQIHLFPTLLLALEQTGLAPKGSLLPDREEAQALIAQLRDDHDFFMSRLAIAVKRLREIARGGAPEDRFALVSLAPVVAVREMVAAVQQRIATHNELEESQVYRWIDALPTPRERAALIEKMQWELENLPPRFRQPERGK